MHLLLIRHGQSKNNILEAARIKLWQPMLRMLSCLFARQSMELEGNSIPKDLWTLRSQSLDCFRPSPWLTWL